MPSSEFSGTVSTPKLSVAVDMGNPFLNLTVDAFLKIGAVGVTKSIAEDAYKAIDKGSLSKNTLENALKKLCAEGVYWGAAAGVYVGTEYGIERVRGTRDWKNAMLAGAATGAVLSAAGKKGKDTVVIDAILGGALATASQFLNNHYFY
ncbi:PREDICTED: outer envelope pore protein 16-1, chloroplastic-like [Camelina sativa]|uniref:Outer envelope pore protein 16-1, chloroplastic-like n=1 Tax=Camelina sativa TaxID=90675 RepID=A0ABM0Z547_CAMSA|nr:PREDICTED: outer envelope pore protein 16-1, chloroplastic-like [Camelina sativa]